MTTGTDEIIDEIRKAREAHAASFDYDLKRIVEELKRLDEESDIPVVTLAPRRPEPMPSGEEG